MKLSDGSKDIISRMHVAYGIKEKHGSLADLGVKLGVDGSVISGWKKRGVPKDKIARATIDTMCSEDWLKTGQGEMHTTIAEDFTGYNVDKLKWVTAQVRRWEIETDQTLEPEDMAETVIKIYEFYVESGEEVSKASFTRLMKLCN